MPPKQNKKKPQLIKPANEGSSNFKDPSLRKRRPGGRTSAACKACKKRKTKCSGRPPPCQMCEQLHTLCVIDLTKDMRRRTAIKHAIEESKIFQDTLNYTIEILRRGNWTEIQDLVVHIQGTNNPDEVVEKLQVRFQGTSDRHSQNMYRQMKEEREESTTFVSEDEDEDEDKVEISGASFVASGSSIKRPVSTHEPDGSRPSINPSQHGSAGEQEFGSLASMYLPLISMLRTASDWEATCVLPDIKTSTVPTGIAALNLSEYRQPRQNLSLQTDRHSISATSVDINSLDRTNWHPSLQLTSSEFQSPIAQYTSPDLWNDMQSANSTTAYFRRSDSYLRTMATSSIGEAAAELCKEVQRHPTAYNAMQVKRSSEVVEMFGDLRAVDGSSSRQASLQEFVVQRSATIPVHLIQSRLALEDSPLSKVFTGFRDAARQMIATGTPTLDIISGSDVVVDLFFRERRPTDTFTCASWACELCRSFSEIPEIVRIGCVFLLTRLMRWIIFPTAETYAEVPECQRPTPTQCSVPHIPAIDLHPIPAIRDILCNRLQNWTTSITLTGVSCNWPFKKEEALENDPASGSIEISKLFAEHVNRCENWSFNSYALSLYPELASKVQVVDI